MNLLTDAEKQKIAEEEKYRAEQQQKTAHEQEELLKQQKKQKQSRRAIGCLALIVIPFVGLYLLGKLAGGNSAPTPASTVKQVSSRCYSAPQELTQVLETGLTAQGSESLRNAYAVRSNDYENVWFVAADIQAPGLEESKDVGVWATNGLELKDGSLTYLNGSIIAADGIAREFSTWGTAGDFSERTFSRSDDGFEEVIDCARKGK